MGKNFLDISLFFSAFIPLYILIIIKEVIEIINGNLSFNILNTVMFFLLIILILLGLAGVYVSIVLNKEEAEEIIILQKKNITDQHFFGYFSLFVLFAISFDLSKVCMSCVFVVVLFFIGVVYIRNGMYYINPFLNLIGYSFYEIEYRSTNSEGKKYAKFFYKGNLEIHSKSYWVKIKNENFSFLDGDKNKQ